MPDFSDKTVIDNTLERLDARNISRRRFLQLSSATFVAAASTAALAGCENPLESEPQASGVTGLKTGDLGSFFLFAGNDWYDEYNAAAMGAAEALSLNYSQASAQGDPTQQLSQVQAEIPTGMDLMVINAPDGSAIPRIGELAVENDILLEINHALPDWFTPFDVGDVFVGYNVPDHRVVGRQMVELAYEALGGPGKLVHITGTPENLVDFRRTLGADEEMESRGMELTAREPGQWAHDAALQVMEDIMSRTKDFDAVIAQNDNEAMGARAALQAADVQVPIVGADGNLSAVQLMSEGELAGTIATFPAWSGASAVVWLADAFNGFERTPPERIMLNTGIKLSSQDQDLVKQYLQRYGADSAPFNYEFMSHVLHPDDWDEQVPLKVLDPDYYFEGIEKPRGWSYPSDLAGAREAGRFEEINELYRDHQRSDPLGPVPSG